MTESTAVKDIRQTALNAYARYETDAAIKAARERSERLDGWANHLRDLVERLTGERPETVVWDEETGWPRVEVDGIIIGCHNNFNAQIRIARRCNDCGRNHWSDAIHTADVNFWVVLGSILSCEQLPYHSCGKYEGDLNYAEEPIAPPPPPTLDDRLLAVLKDFIQRETTKAL